MYFYISASSSLPVTAPVSGSNESTILCSSPAQAVFYNSGRYHSKNIFHTQLLVKNNRVKGIIFFQGKEKRHSMRLTYVYRILMRIQVAKIQILSGRLEKMKQQVSVSKCTHIWPLCIGCADLK